VNHRSVITIERHIIEEERQHPEATGASSNILYDIAFAAKMISHEVNMAGLVDILGGTDERNLHGDDVQKLDAWANEIIFKALDHGGHLCCMASEENEDILAIPERFPTGEYSLVYDPLDGSSNIDANISIGTIFAVHRKISNHPGWLRSRLPSGGPCACGRAIHRVWLIHDDGLFDWHRCSRLYARSFYRRVPAEPPEYQNPESTATHLLRKRGNYSRWSGGQCKLVDHLKGIDSENNAFSSRYVGSLVADFHRTLLYGGLFMYPADTKSPNGKLRLLY
jgi:fructose-1,6-bisphosphatase I